MNWASRWPKKSGTKCWPCDALRRKRRINREKEDQPPYLSQGDGCGSPCSLCRRLVRLRQHVIEGGENSEVVYNNFKHYEIAPYFSYTNHLVMTDVVVANKDFLDDMDEDTRATFRKLMKESMEVEFAAWDQNIEDAKAVLDEHGVTFVEADIDAFRERCMPLLESIANRSDMTREVYDKVQEIKAREA